MTVKCAIAANNDSGASSSAVVVCALAQIDHRLWPDLGADLFGGDARYRLAKKWTFPDSLAEVIRHHHQPEQGGQNLELAHIVFVANVIMSGFHAGLEMEKQDTGALASRLKVIGLSAQQFPQIVDMIPLSVFEPAPESAIGG